MSQAELDWANTEVFGGTLPPYGTIVITNTAGPDGRQFTFPQFGRVISINLGSVMFADPISSGSATFIHELTHAWQITHTSLDLAWVANAFATQMKNSGSI